MNVFWKDIKGNWKNALLWTASLLVLCVWMLDLFTSFQDESGVLLFIEQFPPSFRKAFGIDRLNLSSPEGYFGTEVHLLILLFGSIFAALLGSNVLSKEENEGTVEFLLSKPVSRKKVLSSKVLVYVVLVATFNAIVWAGSFWGMKRYGVPFDVGGFWILCGMTVGAHLTFANLALLGSVFVVRRRTINAGSLGLVLGMYAIQIVGDLSEKAGFLGHISPMKWASAADIFSKGTASPGYAAAMLAVNGVALALAYGRYARKDILI